MKRVTTTRLCMAALIALGLPGIGQAAMSGNATTYGLLPADMATAQALSLFGDQVSATWYNPASLTRGPEGELTGGLFHGQPSLEVQSHGGTNAPTRKGKVLNEVPSQQVLLGMKKNLTDLTTFKHPVYFGFMTGIERFGMDLMAFQSKTSDKGQFFNYNRNPLFLTMGVGTNVWRGIDVGASARLTLESHATMKTHSNLAGDTSRENIQVQATPKFTPVIGVNIAMGKTFCSMTPCALDKLDIAMAFRGESKSKTDVAANAVIPGTVPEPGLDLIIQTIDSYQPPMASLGAKYQWNDFTFGVAGQYQGWSALEGELKHDTVKDQANLRFRDVIVPRIGAEYKFNDMITLRTGVSYVQSPLENSKSRDVNYMDNDRIVVGLGGSMLIKHAPFIAYPVRLDIGYQYHHLMDRDFVLTGTNQNGDQYSEKVTSGGDVNAISGSFTVKF